MILKKVLKLNGLKIERNFQNQLSTEGFVCICTPQDQEQQSSVVLKFSRDLRLLGSMTLGIRSEYDHFTQMYLRNGEVALKIADVEFGEELGGPEHYWIYKDESFLVIWINFDEQRIEFSSKQLVDHFNALFSASDEIDFIIGMCDGRLTRYQLN